MTKKLLILALLALTSIPAFAQSVDTAWVRNYNGPGNGDDSPCAIAADDSGNVYVTGYSAQNSGHPYNFDYATIKYDPDGEELWVRRYNGPGDYYDWATALALDDSGNVYVTGHSYAGATYYDFATIKYYPDGDTAWVRRYNGLGAFADRAWAITVDNYGNVFVTGSSDGNGIGPDYLTVRYYPNGDTAWVRRYNGPRNDCDTATAIAADDSGNVYVTGFSFGIGTLYDYATIKYDSSGNELWLRRYHGEGNGDDLARAMTVDDSGNVYVTGRSKVTDTWFDIATIKYYPDGDTAWIRRYDGPQNQWDYAYDTAVDLLGNLYVIGATPQGGLYLYYDYATIKYYPQGDTAWARIYDGPENGSDIASACVLDDYGNLYVTGNSGTVKYDSSGNQLWVGHWGGVDIALDTSKNVYVTSGTSDYLTVKYVQFLRGDVNSNGSVTISDVVFLVNYLFNSGPDPVPAPIVGDANCDSMVSITDAVYLINYLFRDGPPPCQ